MAHSLEVRVPFVDPFLLRDLAPLTTRAALGTGKRWLGASPRQPLPTALTARPKTGFGIPVADWLEKHPTLQAWRRIPQLAQRGCPWARRWTYQLAAA
jgi:asparagine synthase (glutamine-hydrolysing)